MTLEKRTSPAGDETRSEDSAGDRSGIYDTTALGQPTETHDGAAAFFRDSYAVLVRGKTVRRHLYFNLPAATRTVDRAKARGDRAEMILVRLVPVDARYLDESRCATGGTTGESTPRRELRRDPAVDDRLRGLDE